MKIGFLQDPTGDFSIMRLIFAVGMFWAMGLTTGMAITGTSVPLLVALFSALSGVFIGLKLGQTQMEKTKQPIDNN
jgi:hypothetical protein